MERAGGSASFPLAAGAPRGNSLLPVSPPSSDTTHPAPPTSPSDAKSHDTILRRLIFFALTLALPLLLLIGIGFVDKFGSDRAHATSLLQARRDTAQQMLGKYLERVHHVLLELDRLPAFREMDQAEMMQAAKQFRAINPEFTNVGVIDRAGNLRFSTITPIANPPQNLAALPLIREIMAAQDYQISAAVRSNASGRWVIGVAMPMTGRPDLVLVIYLDLTELSKKLFLAPDNPELVVTVTDRNNTIVLSSLTPFSRIGQKHATASEVAAALAAGRTTGEFLAQDGQSRTYDAGRITSPDWLIVAALPTSEIYRDAWRNLWRALAAIGLVLLLGTGAVYFYARALARPVAALAAAARAQAEGRTETLAPLTGPSEIAATAQAFNELVSARLQAEDALREREVRLRTIIDAEPECVKIVAPDGRLQEMNPAGLAMIEADAIESVRGRSVYPLLAPEHLAQFRAMHERVLRGEDALLEFDIIGLKGTRRSMDTHAVPLRDAYGAIIGQLAVTRDITERKRAAHESELLHRKLQETQKLESLGILAGGIAHDFNNLLTGVLGHASLAKLDLPAGNPALENIDQIEIAARRAAELCRQMLAYSGKGRFVIQRLDLNELIEDSIHLLQISVSKHCVLRTNLTHPLPAISADATQVRQIIMNLVINASEAIGTRSGVIALNTGIVRADAHYLQTLRFTPDIPPGDYVFIEVSDNGSGMDDATLRQIFDPFFTTKFTGRGLGLAAVLGIMRGHRGGVKVYSEPGRGTTFKMLFPCVAGAADALDLPPTAQVAWRGHGTVLVIDDEETVRAVAARMLEALGFGVVLAEHGRDGFDKFRIEPDRYTLVLLDLTMPHMDGQETFRQLRLLRPEVKILLMSGFNQQEAVSPFTGKGLAGFVQKPFELATLAIELRRVLEAPARAS